MKKYIIAGAVGFLIHAAWIAFGIALNSWSYLNIYLYHGKNIEQKSLFAAAVDAIIISIVLVVISRALLFRAKYNGKAKWLIGAWVGVGFYLAFWALIILFQLVFSGFGF